MYREGPTRYNPGSAHLYNMASGRTGRQLTHLTSPNGIDVPPVGASIEAWKLPATVKVGAYDLKAQKPVELNPSDGGRADTAGHVLLYVAPSNPKHPARAGYVLAIDRLK